MTLSKPKTINKIDNMYLLHSNESHFDLLVPKSIEYNKNTREKEIILSEVDVLGNELAESKKGIKSLKELLETLLPKVVDNRKHTETQLKHVEVVTNNNCGDCGQKFTNFINLDAHV